MLLDLSKLRGQREHFERTFQPSAFDPQDEAYRVATPVEVSMDIEKSGPGIFRVQGRAATRLMMECGRCLDEIEVPVDARFELRYVPQAENEGEPEREIADDDLTTAFYREGPLDVIDMLREQFELRLPVKPLGGGRGRGRCRECGPNLNGPKCGWEPRWADPRLEPLKALLNG